MGEKHKFQIDRLPEACLSQILSFTSPSDAIRATIVSPTLRVAADSNLTWSRFLPSNYHDILTRAVHRVAYSSSKELYFKLCDPVPIDDGNKILSLEKKTGAISILLSAKEFSIVHINDRRYWQWVPDPHSRFIEVAELLQVCWLEFNCGIDCRQFSHNRRYRSYLIFKIAENAFGLKNPPQDVSVRLGNQISEGKVCVRPNEDDWDNNEIPLEAHIPQVRSDGWMEVELGDIYNEYGGEEHIVMSFKHLKPNWCGGLIIEGIQVRPA